MRQTIVRLSTMVACSYVAAAGCRSAFRAGIEHRDGGVVASEVGVEAQLDEEVGSDTGSDAKLDVWFGDDVSTDSKTTAKEAGNDVPVDASNDAGMDVRAPTLKVLAGLPGGPGNLDGIGPAARFRSPEGIASDRAGHLFVADWESNGGPVDTIMSSKSMI